MLPVSGSFLDCAGAGKTSAERMFRSSSYRIFSKRAAPAASGLYATAHSKRQTRRHFQGRLELQVLTFSVFAWMQTRQAGNLLGLATCRVANKHLTFLTGMVVSMQVGNA